MGRKPVVCLYSKSGGKGGKHNGVTDSSNITALSHIGVQVFEHSHFRWFTQIPSETARLHTRQFALLFPMCLLLCLQSPVETNGTKAVEISHNDFLEFKDLSGGLKRVREALHKYGEE